MFGVLILSYYIFLDFLGTWSLLWHTSFCHFTLICSFIIKHWLSWSNVFCCHGSFVWALFHFLLTLSPVIFHPAFTFTGPTSVCTLSDGRGRLRELPLHAFITCAIFTWGARLCSAGDEREDALGVWDQREAAACFSFDLDSLQVFFHLSCFIPSLYLCTVGNVWYILHFYSISRLLSLVFIGSFPSTACCCRSSSHISGLNHVRVPPLLLPWFAPEPFNLFFFISVLPLLHYIIFALHFLFAVLPWSAW